MIVHFFYLFFTLGNLYSVSFNFFSYFSANSSEIFIKKKNDFCVLVSENWDLFNEYIIKYRLVNLALAGSIGMTLVILACALPQYK